MTQSQAECDKANSEFWDEPCGTSAANMLGLKDTSPASLKQFDDWFFDYYPYLYDHIPFDALHGKKVMEVGLGYGSVSQKLAESGADVTGLDIAQGPVYLLNKRLTQSGLPGKAVVGSILDCPFDDETFDFVVSIGFLHYTGICKRDTTIL